MPPVDRHRLAHGERQRHRAAGVRSLPLATSGHRRHRRRRGVDLQLPAGLVTAPVRLAALPAASVMVAELRLIASHRQVGRVLPGRHRVAEGQRVAARAAGIGRGAAVVERQRRRAARDVDRLAQVERERHGVPAQGRQPAVMPLPTPPPTSPSAPWCRSAAPAGLVTAPARLAALPAASVTVAALRLTAVTARSARVLAGGHRVAEGQRIAAGAARIGRGAAVVERQRRRAARDRHRLAQVDRERHRLPASRSPEPL